MVHNKLLPCGTDDGPASLTGRGPLAPRCPPTFVQQKVGGAQRDSEWDQNWEDFFGASVDITSTLVEMYDSLLADTRSSKEEVATNKPTPVFQRPSSCSSFSDGGAAEPKSPDSRPDDDEDDDDDPLADHTASAWSTGGRGAVSSLAPQNKADRVNLAVGAEQLASGMPEDRAASATKFQRSYSLPSHNKRDHCRPLSVSSVSSSSSSSSSSLPQNGLDVKKSYLASIESLDDEECGESGGRDPDVQSSPEGFCPPLHHHGYRNYSVCNHRHLRCGNGNRYHHQGSANGASADASAPTVSTPSGTPAIVVVSPPVRPTPRFCDPNLGYTDRVILEILETERTYVRDLNDIVEGYLHHMLNRNNIKITKQNVAELFGNIEDIFTFNSGFLSELEQCGMDPVALARCFVTRSTGFAVYTQYCTNYPRTVSVLTELMRNRETAEELKGRQLALHHSLPLGCFLLKPVQRILKYHLLLQNIVKHTDKENQGYPDIKNALSVMTGVAYHINDMKRKHEHAVRVQEIQSLLYGWEGQDLTTYGELAAEGTFQMFGAKALRHLFLFDKMLLIAKKKEEGILSYKTHIVCSNLMLIESIQGEPLCFHVIPFDNPRHQYTFQARNQEQKREWCLQLKRVILENYHAVIPTHARQLVMELGQNKHEDSAPVERSTTKRQLSAPEYLEKRKQERRKSEIVLNKAFRLKKGVKKGDALSQKDPQSSSQRGRRPRSTPHGSVQPQLASEKQQQQETNFSKHILPSGWNSVDEAARSNSKQQPCQTEWSRSPTVDDGLYVQLQFPNIKNQHLYESSVCAGGSGSAEQKCPGPGEWVQPRRARGTWKVRNSVPEETTDTENEDNGNRVDIQQLLQHRPTATNFRVRQVSESMEDLAGEYVTFFFAQSHALREILASQRPDDGERDKTTETTQKPFTGGETSASAVSERVSPLPAIPGKDASGNNEDARLTNYDNLVELWTRLGTVQLEDTVSEDMDRSPPPLRKQNSALRRVQSFTGMARAKVASLHHTLSFRQSSDAGCGVPDRCAPAKPRCQRPSLLSLEDADRLPVLPPTIDDMSPTAPAVWLQQQEEHLADVFQKCGSLPRSFQLGQEGSQVLPSTEMQDADGCQQLHLDAAGLKPRMRTEGSRIVYPEQRPFTIAADKPLQVDFMDDLERYIEDSSEQPAYRFPVSREVETETTTGCTNTPAVSMENVSIHPEHKIYRQAALKYSTLKAILLSVGSKLTGLKASLSSPGGTDQTDSCSTVSAESDPNSKTNVLQMRERSFSSSSIKTERDLSPKHLTTRFVHSLAKAYSSMIKQKLKREDNQKPTEGFATPVLPRMTRPGNGIVGARMARSWETEYCIPHTLAFLARPVRPAREGDPRPDSVLSESSNATSSSDGDKTSTVEMFLPAPLGQSLTERLSQTVAEQDDSPSDTSDSSGDSYYERTFEALENVLPEEVFRDSAIYSDPEDADLSATESVLFSCKEGVENETKLQETDGTKRLESTPPPPPVKRHSIAPRDAEASPVTVKSHVSSPIKIKGAIMEKLKILEENTQFRKDDPLGPAIAGLKTIRERRLELEKWCIHGNVDESEASSEHSAPVTATIETISCFKTAASLAETKFSAVPRTKGWVRHVVDKLQAESL